MFEDEDLRKLVQDVDKSDIEVRLSCLIDSMKIHEILNPPTEYNRDASLIQLGIAFSFRGDGKSEVTFFTPRRLTFGLESPDQLRDRVVKAAQGTYGELLLCRRQKKVLEAIYAANASDQPGSAAPFYTFDAIHLGAGSHDDDARIKKVRDFFKRHELSDGQDGSAHPPISMAPGLAGVVHMIAHSMHAHASAYHDQAPPAGSSHRLETVSAYVSAPPTAENLRLTASENLATRPDARLAAFRLVQFQCCWHPCRHTPYARTRAFPTALQDGSRARPQVSHRFRSCPFCCKRHPFCSLCSMAAPRLAQGLVQA